MRVESLQSDAMSDFNEYIAAQRAKLAHEVEQLNAVLSAGETLGLWAVVPDEYATLREPEDRGATHREVQTAEGNRYSITLDKGRVAACVAPVSTEPRQQGIRFHVSDLRKGDAPSATVALDRGPGTCAKEIHRRVVLPGASVATELRVELARRVEMREHLLANVERMKAAGCQIPQHFNRSDGEYYEAKMWAPTVGSVRVTSSGNVYVDHTVTVDVGDFGKLLEIAR